MTPKTRVSVYQRDGWRCRHCKNRNGIHPHHVIKQSKGDASKDEMNNLLTLCWICHEAYHAGKLAIHVLRTDVNDVIVRFERLKGWKP